MITDATYTPCETCKIIPCDICEFYKISNELEREREKGWNR
jgi:hypothetical protein